MFRQQPRAARSAESHLVGTLRGRACRGAGQAPVRRRPRPV